MLNLLKPADLAFLLMLAHTCSCVLTCSFFHDRGSDDIKKGFRGPKLGQKILYVKSVDFSGGRVTFLHDHAKTADFNGFNAKIPYNGPPHAYLTS